MYDVCGVVSDGANVVHVLKNVVILPWNSHREPVFTGSPCPEKILASESQQPGFPRMVPESKGRIVGETLMSVLVLSIAMESRSIGVWWPRRSLESTVGLCWLVT